MSKLALQLTPSQIQFQEVPVGEVSSQMVRLTNAGQGLVQIYRIEVRGAEFSVTGQVTPFVIATGTGADFTISCRPKSEGSSSGHVLIYVTQGAEPISLDLIASAVTADQELVANAASLEFSDVAVGNRSVKDISLTNAGNRELTLAGISVTGDSAFTVAGPTSVKLAPHQKIDLTVAFRPTSAGLRSGVLKISGSNGATTVEIPLTATGALGTSSLVQLRWEGDPASTASYTVYRSADASGPFEQVAASLNATEYLDGGLVAGHTYYYVVTATRTDESEGEFSAPISATVPEG